MIISGKRYLLGKQVQIAVLAFSDFAVACAMGSFVPSLDSDHQLPPVKFLVPCDSVTLENLLVEASGLSRHNHVAVSAPKMLRCCSHEREREIIFACDEPTIIRRGICTSNDPNLATIM